MDHQTTVIALLQLSGALDHLATSYAEPAHREFLRAHSRSAAAIARWHGCPLGGAIEHQQLLDACDDLAHVCHALAADEADSPAETIYWSAHETRLEDLCAWHQRLLNDIAANIRRKHHQQPTLPGLPHHLPLAV